MAPQAASKATAKTLKFQADPSEPAHLSPDSRENWRQIVRDYGKAGDTIGLSLLELALTSWDRAEQARLIVEEQGAYLKDRYGGIKPHPALRVQTMYMDRYMAAIKRLNVEVEPVLKVGRPPGR